MGVTIQKNPNDRELHLRALDALRFPLVLAVMIEHVIPLIPLQQMFSATGNYPLFNCLINFIYAFLRDQSVPIYFFISGYLFFLGGEFSKETFFHKLKNRVRTLFIPYMAWNTLAILALYIVNSPALIYDPSILNFSLEGFSAYWAYNGGLLKTTVYNDNGVPICYQLWFLRNLMIVILFAPLIYGLIKRFRWYIIAFIGAMWFLSSASCSKLLQGCLTTVFFFSLGAYMSISKKDLIAVFGRFSKSSIILYPCLGVLCMASAYIGHEAAVTFKYLNIFVGLFFAYNIAVWLLREKHRTVNAFLASASFFVYASHTIILQLLNFARYLVYRFLLHLPILIVTPSEYVCNRAIAFVLTLAISLTAFRLMKRYTPSTLRILTGRKYD